MLNCVTRAGNHARGLLKESVVLKLDSHHVSTASDEGLHIAVGESLSPSHVTCNLLVGF